MFANFLLGAALDGALPAPTPAGSTIIGLLLQTSVAFGVTLLILNRTLRHQA